LLAGDIPTEARDQQLHIQLVDHSCWRLRLDKIDLDDVGAGLGSGRVLPARDIVEATARWAACSWENPWNYYELLLSPTIWRYFLGFNGIIWGI